MLTPGIRATFETKKKTLLAFSDLKELGGATPKPESAKTETTAFAASVPAAQFLRRPELAHETFGPFALIILAETDDELKACIQSLEGQLTATLHGTPDDLIAAQPLISILEQKVGRILVNGFPTGVEVSPAMHHGGPYPATSDARFTSVGTAAILRFARPICYQNFPAALLPPALRNENSLGILRLVNGRYVRDAIV
jgi:NADP-dependent aldehyde dehydrogenase